MAHTDQLLISKLYEFGRLVHSRSEVITHYGTKSTTFTFAETGVRIGKLANALDKLGIKPGDNIATFGMNSQTQLECYLAIPSMGAILQTLNTKFYSEQLSYILQEGKNKIIIFDAKLADLLYESKKSFSPDLVLIAAGECSNSNLSDVLDYESIIANENSEFDWPLLDEREPAVICYTTGTTGEPKGIVYSHRTIYLHSVAMATASNMGITAKDTALVCVPMFHALAWGLTYTMWAEGANMILPYDNIQPKSLLKFFETNRPTFALGVPTILKDILNYVKDDTLDLSFVRYILSGGSAVPKKLIETFRSKCNTRIVQVYGSTESLMCSISFPPSYAKEDEEIEWLSQTGTLVAGIDFRVVDPNGKPLPHDGTSAGEFEVKGPWVITSYLNGKDPHKFHDGWFRMGDLGTCDAEGHVQIADRIKDLIKSGGEWISSIELENSLLQNEFINETSVIGIPDEQWEERPLVFVVMKNETEFDPNGLASWLKPKFAKWQIPEYWVKVDNIPRTSVGKVDKKQLRKLYSEDKLQISVVDKSTI